MSFEQNIILNTVGANMYRAQKEASRQTTLPCFELRGRPVQHNSNADSRLKQTDRTDSTENRTGETE